MCSREVVCFQWDTNWIVKYYLERNDCLSGLVVIPGFRSRGPLSYTVRLYSEIWQPISAYSKCMTWWSVLTVRRASRENKGAIPLKLSRTSWHFLSYFCLWVQHFVSSEVLVSGWRANTRCGYHKNFSTWNCSIPKLFNLILSLGEIVFW
jgi:hypothetical protein